MSNKFPFPKGSEWRKWDLHLHGPYDVLNCQFQGTTPEEKLENYITKVEQIELSAIAVTNYFCIDGFAEVLNQKENGRLQQVDLIIPNIEFRLTQPNRQGEYINIHVIFSDSFANEEGIQRIVAFLSRLPLLSTDSSNRKLYCTKQDIQRVGGYEKVMVEFTQLIECLEQNFKQRKDYLIIGVARGLGSFRPSQNEGRGESLAIAIDKNSDLFFGNVDDIKHFLNIDRFENASQKPVVLGSDSHSLDTIGTRYSWIKTDPTFEGLKQILYEPYENERVYIGEEPPSKAIPSKVIRSIELQGSNEWFEDGKIIEFNPSMASLIGGKGTGKTALLDLIALVANKNLQEIEENDSSFIKKAKMKLHNLKVKIAWLDGSTDEISFRDLGSLANSDVNKKVEYLSQGFITTLCKDENINNLQDQIESVIFQNVKDEEKAIYSDFKGLKQSRLETINWKRRQIQENLKTINSDIKDKLILVTQKNKLQTDIAQKKVDLGKVDEQVKILTEKITHQTEENKALLEEYQKVNELKNTIEKEIATLVDNNEQVGKISQEIAGLKNKVSQSLEELNLKLTELGVNSILEFSITPNNIQQLIQTYINEKQADIQTKVTKRNEVKTKFEELVTKLKLEKTRSDALRTLSEQQKTLKEEIESLEKKLELTDLAEKQIPDLNVQQLDFFNNFIVTLVEERKVLQKIYEPLKFSLESGEEEEQKKLFGFEIRLDFDHEEMAKIVNTYIDHRKDGQFQNKDENYIASMLQQAEAILSEIDLSSELLTTDTGESTLTDENKTKVKQYIEQVIRMFSTPDGPVEVQVQKQLNSIYTIEDFYDWLFSSDYYSLKYAIKFDGRAIDELTPGLKGIALLILYLELDQDNKPIIIDQPEENLDNRSVYKTLVEYFRKAKKKRQVIIATHNGNLVVNTDSEQVIVANFDKSCECQEAKICYVSGSLENNFKDRDINSILLGQGIREHCCEVLEGGPRAFRKREQKYDFPTRYE